MTIKPMKLCRDNGNVSKFKIYPIFIYVIAGALLCTFSEKLQAQHYGSVNEITHGPVLGEVTTESVRVWVRTARPAGFQVVAKSNESDHEARARGETHLADDFTGWTKLDGLNPGEEYEYHVRLMDYSGYTKSGSFRTIPHPDHVRNKEHNPTGLFNFKFEFGACNFQHTGMHHDPLMPAYKTMNEKIKDQVLFHIMHGDFIYEAHRGMEVSKWQEINQIADDNVPEELNVMPRIVGIWENYKLYYDKAPELREWHRNVPGYFMFDDHEILNDISATSVAGHRDRVTLHRDIGIAAWQDYLGWANPDTEYRGRIYLGKGEVTEGEDILFDPHASFTGLDEGKISNLHIHWQGGHPAAAVYDIVEIVDENRIRISPEALGTGRNLSYSIGTHHFYSFQVGNAEFFVTDTRGMRDLHDKDRPHQDISMLGETQLQWLVENMKTSDADFLFVVSPVSFFIPHIGPQKPEKDESWTVYINERDKLMEVWEEIGKPVLLLTGDLHNGAAIQASDNVWEFLSAAHNSPNHHMRDEDYRPTNGMFTYNDRTVDIHWSTFFLDDVPGKFSRRTLYTVVQFNNVFNNPTDKANPRWVAYERPQVIVTYYDGETGELLYSQSIRANER